MTNLRRRPPADDLEPEHAAGSSNPRGQTMEVKFADFGGGHAPARFCVPFPLLAIPSIGFLRVGPSLRGVRPPNPR